MNSFSDLMEMLTEMDPGILTFGIIVFAPGFIVAAAVVYFVLRSIIRAIRKPSQERKATQEKERKTREVQRFLDSLDKCTVYDVSPLLPDVNRIKDYLRTAHTYNTSAYGRRADVHEQFICYKKLEQLGHHDYATLASYYVDHFSQTDKDKKAALKYTGILADMNYPYWMLEYAKMLLRFRDDPQSTQKALSLYKALCQTDGDPYLPLPEEDDYRAEATWLLANHILKEESSKERMREAEQLIFQSALLENASAIHYLQKKKKELEREKLKHRQYELETKVLTSLFNPGYGTESTLRRLEQLVLYGYPDAIDGVGLTYSFLAEKGNDTDHKLFLLYQLGTTLDIPKCMWHLAMAYMLGEGTKQDDKQGIKWTKQAAERNICSAQNAMGLITEDNERFDEAVDWYKRSIENATDDFEGDLCIAQSAGKLCAIYTEGRPGIAPDADQASHWQAIKEKVEKKRPDLRD